MPRFRTPAPALFAVPLAIFSACSDDPAGGGRPDGSLPDAAAPDSTTPDTAVADIYECNAAEAVVAADTEPPMVRIVWNGNGYGFAYASLAEPDNSEIFFRALDARGSPIGVPKRVSNSADLSLSPALAWNGTEYGIAWHDTRDGGGPGFAEIYFARLNIEGDKLGGDLRVSDAPGQSYRPAIAWSRDRFGITWNDDRDGDQEIYFANIDAQGAELGDDLRITRAAGLSLFSDLAGDGNGGFGAVWDDTRDGNDQVYFARIEANGAAGDRRLSPDNGAAYEARIAWNGDGFGVLWTAERTAGTPDSAEIFFARFTSAGERIGDVVPVHDPDSASPQPAFTWTGTEYGAVWLDLSDGEDLLFARLDPTGAVFGAPSSLLGDGPGIVQPWLIWDGRRYALAFHRGMGNDPRQKFFRHICP